MKNPTDEPYRLEEWAITEYEPDPYTPPEARGIHLSGIVTGHPKWADAHRVTTSRVVEVNGRIVTTRSGSIYRLGEVSENYLKWLTEHGYKHDPENPIRVKTPVSVN